MPKKALQKGREQTGCKVQHQDELKTVSGAPILFRERLLSCKAKHINLGACLLRAYMKKLKRWACFSLSTWEFLFYPNFSWLKHYFSRCLGAEAAFEVCQQNKSMPCSTSPCSAPGRVGSSGITPHLEWGAPLTLPGLVPWQHPHSCRASQFGALSQWEITAFWDNVHGTLLPQPFLLNLLHWQRIIHFLQPTLNYWKGHSTMTNTRRRIQCTPQCVTKGGGWGTTLGAGLHIYLR